MSKFTNGTWSVGISEKYGPYVYAGDGDAIIAVIRNCGHISESNAKDAVCQANARLMAAAPEMYRLICEFIKIDEQKARAATEKNDPAFMMALMAQDGAVNMAKELIARIDREEASHE